MASSKIMLALMGTMYATPAAPSGMSSVRAASGPYAAELSASRPKIGIPARGPICSARSSLVASGLPNSRFKNFVEAAMKDDPAGNVRTWEAPPMPVSHANSGTGWEWPSTDAAAPPCSLPLMSRQLAAISRLRRLLRACVEYDLPIAIGLLAPHGDVAAAGDHGIAVLIFSAPFVMAPGVSHIAGRSHHRVGRRPCKLVILGRRSEEHTSELQ